METIDEKLAAIRAGNKRNGRKLKAIGKQLQALRKRIGPPHPWIVYRRMLGVLIPVSRCASKEGARRVAGRNYCYANIKRSVARGSGGAGSEELVT